MTPEMGVAAKNNHKKRNDSKYCGKSNIAGNIRSAGYQPDYIIYEDKKE